MDPFYLPRLQASATLPAWRRAWRRPGVQGNPAPHNFLRAAEDAAPVVVPLPPALHRPAPRPEHAPAAQPSQDGRLSVRQDPADARRVRVAGSMAEVCAALDRLVRWQESGAR